VRLSGRAFGLAVTAPVRRVSPGALSGCAVGVGRSDGVGSTRAGTVDQ